MLTLQGLLWPINENLNITLALICTIVFFTLGLILGRMVRWQDAKRMVHDALDRLARDIYLYRVKEEGSAVGKFAQRALEEAEAMTRWRSLENNYLAKPTGESRRHLPPGPRIADPIRQRALVRQALNKPPLGIQDATVVIPAPAVTADAAMAPYLALKNSASIRYNPDSPLQMAVRSGRRRRR